MARSTSETTSQTNRDESLGDLFADLSRETGTLVREEVALAKTEITHKFAAAGKDIGFLVAGGAIAYAGLLALVATAIVAIAQLGLWPWLAALIVAVVVLGIGGFLAMRGISNLKHLDVAPRATLDSLKEDASWAKEQI
ncbi:MAG: phage holin family protein [Chloroflexota bacterium]